jgi:D-alanyl-D-alanine carboxypeptidase
VASLLAALVLGVAISGCGGDGVATGGPASTTAGGTPAVSGAAQGTAAARTPLQGYNGTQAPAAISVPLRLQPAPAISRAFRDPLRKHPRAGIVADLDTGAVLWAVSANRDLPIASVTKLMTALIVDARTKPTERVRISRRAVAAQGSSVGLLPVYKRVQLETLLYGLLLPSGNDAAIALAEHVGGSVEGFVDMMNAQAKALGMTCTRFGSPNGFEEVKRQRDAKNRSCAADLAVLARLVLDRPRLAKIVATRDVVRPFPIKGRKLFLHNHNPLLRDGYPGTLGLKTGFTNAAGRTFVGAARRGGHRLVVVLLDTPDIGRQAEALLDAGFRTLGVRTRAR